MLKYVSRDSQAASYSVVGAWVSFLGLVISTAIGTLPIVKVNYSLCPARIE